ncbi:MAG: MCE family protein [Solirubrobacteraceae bacterium]|nr:MCE family protein [Solirubrobacteraceae bacterium]
MGALPMYRAALVALIIASVVGVGYTLRKVSVGLPFHENHYTLHVQLKNAVGLDQADHPLATVAGTIQGRVADVTVKDGQAVATLELDPEVDGKIFDNASAVVRPIGAVPVLSINVDPGSPDTGAMPDGGTVAMERTSSYEAPDKLLSTFDVDTRAYLQVLLGEADKTLDGRGDDLERALVASAPLAASGRRLTEAVADRRRLVSQLVSDVSTIADTVAKRRDELAVAVDSGSQVLNVTGSRSPELSQAMRELPATMKAAQRALDQIQTLSGPLNESLDATLPVLDDLPEGLQELRELTPTTKKLIDDLAALEKRGKEQLPEIRKFTSRLGQAATEGRPAVDAAARTVNTLSNYSDGVAQLGDVVSGAVSTGDINGAMARAIVTAVEPANPANFGFDQRPEGTSAPRSASTASSAFKTKAQQQAEVNEGLATLLDQKCATDRIACILRAIVPGLPGNEKVKEERG